VSIQVMNPEGLGPASTVVVMTEEGVPSHPLNITELQVANDSITLHWIQPQLPNGVIAGYRLYYMTKKMTDVVTVKDSSDEIIYRLQDLEPYKKYTIWAKAFTSKHEGNSSATLTVLTDVAGPGRPLVTNLTCPTANSLFLEWTQPDHFYHSVDSYVVHWRARGQQTWDTRTILVPPVDRPTTEKMLLPNLTTNIEYELYTQALTSSLYREDLVYPGKLSETHTLTVNRNCDSILVSPMREEELKDNAMVSLAIVVGATGVFLVLLVAVMSLAFWRRRKMKNHFYIPSSQSQRDDLPLWDLESLDNESGKTPIPANIFPQHVDLLHADGGLGFQKEYDYIQAATSEKKGKLDDSNNLTWVDGYQNKNAYVMTNIYSDCDLNKFWQFILEQSIQVVIFPECQPLLELSGEVECLGALSVLASPPSQHAGFTLQGFRINRRRISKKEETHYVNVYHYSPSKPRVKEKIDFLRFVKHSFNSNKTGGQILLSRTSAALTYMTVCTMLQQSQLRGELNIITYLTHLLNTSPSLDLPHSQYVFIHDVLAEALVAGNTSVVKHNLPCYVRSLESSESGPEGFPSWKVLEKQFTLATELHPPSHQYLTAVNPVNQVHNNSMDYVAVDLTRVVLQPTVGGTDYINCSWVPGYSRSDQYVLSQHPGPSSVGQFWHMVFQSEAPLIVCLSVFQQPFWPVAFQQPLQLGRLTVSLLAETSVSGYQAVSLSLQVEGKPVQAVQLIFCPNWPHLSVPVSNCVHLVDCLTRLADPEKPTVVIDSFGATEAAIFVVLCSLVRQMDLEENVDVFYWFKCVHLCRPGVWVSPDNLLFLYRVMAELCGIKRTVAKNISSSSEINI